ncbi:conserved hypothetical protein [Neospora caninum Liverpool]|uniref:Transmembrane protein n=1 Tax=Neospora caninum (strain Liverpool) TaxID=572307 RepID=F0VQR6_NEOCL|nr:conserved hypothetical protein [Neospora caninum Liverpool]CBZ56063.1 conserved hypothetical protein [Neospora caninum Liverpool]CEL70811.1 TPA: hypothetical protein BN1204_064890 [Neospora caninum Liverpool]|eukprot:XP_003886089.1 conserved hypothetical protein [Neospora caninum Liverpool]
MATSVSARSSTLGRPGRPESEARPSAFAEKDRFPCSTRRKEGCRASSLPVSLRGAKWPGVPSVLVSCLVTLVFATATNVSESASEVRGKHLCEFKGIDLSSGRVSSFAVDTPEYTIQFATKQAELIVSPRFECPENIAPQLLPSVFVNGNPVDPRGTLGTTLPVPTGRWFDVKLEVRNPSSAPSPKVYTLHVDQRQAISEPSLQTFSVQDSHGNALPVTPLFTNANDAFVLAAGVNDAYISLHAQCDPSSALYINGNRSLLSASVKVPRDERQPSSLTTVECRRTGDGEASQRTYFLETLWTRTDLSPPSKLIVHGTGRACEVLPAEEARILCENSGRLASLFALFPPSVFYKVASAEDDSFSIPLVNGGWTPRFPLRADLQITARAGSAEKLWKLDFTHRTVSGHASAWLSTLQTCSVLCFLPALLGISAILFLALLTGQGGARKFSEVPLTALFFFQASFFLRLLQKGPDVLQTSTAMLGWTMLFLPLPSIAETNVELAAGCFVVSGVLLVMTGVLRATFRAVLFQRKPADALPHNLQFGNSEFRLLHALSFPLAAAAAMLMADADSTPRLQLVGSLAALFLTSYHLGIFFFVRSLVSAGRVFWLWSHPLHAAADATDGRWCDIRSDQLVTEPVHWTVGVSAPTGAWFAPAAQISPITVRGAAAAPGAKDSSAWQLRSEGPPGSSAVDVDVLRPKHGPALLPCLRDLPVGIVRSGWIDTFFTLETLTKLVGHQREVGNAGYSHSPKAPVALPLTVKRHQLTGPITAGRFALFFELRTPCSRIGDSVVRSLLGLLLGLAASFEGVVASALLVSAALVSFAWMLYIRLDQPFHRADENAVFPALFALVGCGALTCRGPAALRTSFLSTLLEHISVYMLLALALYTAFVAACLVLGVVWPALQEIRRLPRLCNSTLFLTDRQRNFSVSCPAYNLFPVRNVLLECSAGPGPAAQVRRVSPHANAYAQLEFSVEEFRARCCTGDLEKPSACIFIDSVQSSLRFRSRTVYAGDDLKEAVDSFLDEEPALGNTYPDLRDFLLGELERSQGDSSVATIDVRLVGPQAPDGLGSFPATARSANPDAERSSAEADAGMQFSRTAPLLEKYSSDVSPSHRADAATSPLSSRSWREMS